MIQMTLSNMFRCEGSYCTFALLPWSCRIMSILDSQSSMLVPWLETLSMPTTIASWLLFVLHIVLLWSRYYNWVRYKLIVYSKILQFVVSAQWLRCATYHCTYTNNWNSEYKGGKDARSYMNDTIDWNEPKICVTFLDLWVYIDSNNSLQWKPYWKVDDHFEIIPWKSFHPNNIKHGMFIRELSHLTILSSKLEHYLEVVHISPSSSHTGVNNTYKNVGQWKIFLKQPEKIMLSYWKQFLMMYGTILAFMTWKKPWSNQFKALPPVAGGENLINIYPPMMPIMSSQFQL